MTSDLGDMAKQMAQTSGLNGRTIGEAAESFKGVRLRIWICSWNKRLELILLYVVEGPSKPVSLPVYPR